jgi:hypothetical protein
MISINIKKEFSDDFLSRKAGERLRSMILEATKGNHKAEIDFSGIIIASTSFFDEGFAKLAEMNWTKDKFSSLLTLKNINPKDESILWDLFNKRLGIRD